MVYLCKHCGTIANYPLTGLCEQSPTQEHECVCGEEIVGHLQMLWDRKASDLAGITG